MRNIWLGNLAEIVSILGSDLITCEDLTRFKSLICGSIKSRSNIGRKARR